MPSLMDLLEAGVHFGHKKERSHPKMKDYTFSLREGVFIIDLDKTKDLLESALVYLKQEINAGKTVLFVGTKRQAKEIVQRVAIGSGMPYIVHRWLGGTLTNYETVRRSINEMESLESKIGSPEFNTLTKKERKVINDRLEKLHKVFGGVKEMKKLPDIVFVVDGHREKLAIDEASRMGIPVIAIADTDSNPVGVTHVVPANDDAVKPIELIMGEVEKVVSIKNRAKVVPVVVPAKPAQPEKVESKEDKTIKQESKVKEAK